MTSDHGGTGDEHQKVTDPENYTIPFLVLGPGVPPGVDLYDLDPERTDPGTTQPRYESSEVPIRNGDVTNLVASLIGAEPVTGSQFGVLQPLRVSR